MEINILYEDSQIVVCYKPYGLLSQQSSSEKNMVDLLTDFCGCDIFPVHRLDKQTDGLIVYAKTKKSAAILSDFVQKRKIYKEYEALVHGNLTPEKGEMRDLLYRDKAKNKSYVVKRERKGVKAAFLEYEVLEKRIIDGDSYSLVKIVLHTGRTHQIRVQFASRGFSLAGDRRYGGRDNFEQLQLSAVRLAFSHPTTGEQMQFSIKE